MMVDNIIKSIKIHEGFSPHVYIDSMGVETVGYGFTIKDFELSEGIASTILRIVVLNLIIKANEEFKWFYHMPQKVKEVVVEMCYQLGINGFAEFEKTIEYLQNHQWVMASDEMLNSVWAKEQTPSRAKHLSDIVRSQANA